MNLNYFFNDALVWIDLIHEPIVLGAVRFEAIKAALLSRFAALERLKHAFIQTLLLVLFHRFVHIDLESETNRLQDLRTEVVEAWKLKSVLLLLQAVELIELLGERGVVNVVLIPVGYFLRFVLLSKFDHNACIDA